MNCPICGAESATLLCKNCEAKNDKINNWYSTFKSGMFGKETRISLYLSKFPMNREIKSVVWLSRATKLNQCI